jgi:hypothetical protein
MYYSVMPETQNFKNHGRFDPPFHFIAAPILLINLIACIVITIAIALHPHGTNMLLLHIWLVVVSFALLVVATNSRVKDLKLQDRLIRLEERLRYAALLSQADLAASEALTLRQIVALPLRLGRRTSSTPEARIGRKARVKADQTEHRQLARR